ncbi:MAG: TonB C-terminal domain-containing protein [Bdellovibrionales bacterium]|nr:TonB C-terminal domain-containing protein [Bdellovibrionales bacterium]
MTDSLSKSISLSITFHIGLFVVFLLKMSFFPAQPIEIKRAIRVDLVGLPEKAQKLPPPIKEEPKKVEVPQPKAEPTPTPPKPTPAKPKPAPTPAKPKPKVPTKKIAKSQESAINKLKAMEALEKIKEEKKEVPQEVKGNVVSEGNSLSGLEQIEYDRYFDEVEQMVYAQWALPEWLSSSDFRAQVLVLIDQSGYVTDKKIIRGSGNEMFDAEVMNTIEKSSPFPAPPARLKGILANQGIVFNFPN